MSPKEIDLPTILHQESTTLECMAFSPAFDALVRDYTIEHFLIARCPSTFVIAAHMPTELSERLSLPPWFDVTKFIGRVLIFPELPDSQDDQSEDDIQADVIKTYHFEATCQINEIKVAIASDHEQTTVVLENPNGHTTTEVFDPTMSTHFIATLALSSLDISDEFIMPEIYPIASNEVTLAKILLQVGKGSGNYSDRHTAYLPPKQSGKGLLIALTERETASASGISVDYRMAWSPAEGMLNEVASHQGEALQNNIRHRIRLSARKPGILLPQDLDLTYDASIETDENTVVFDPDADQLEYDRVNISIMDILKHYLRGTKYKLIEPYPYPNYTKKYGKKINPNS
jgi:hypothetical protein